MSAAPHLTPLSQKHKPISDRRTFDQLCRLLGVDDSEKWDERNIDSFYPHNSTSLTEEEALKWEEESRDEAWAKYYGAVLGVAEEVFDFHGLSLVPVIPRRSKEVKMPWEFRIRPNPGRTWKDCAEKIRQTVNGVGYFEFGSVQSFMRSGPYTARECVLNHLGWIPDWYEVYEGGKAKSRVERRLR